jgi:D-alanine--poly(phosphoribitol) ligase subunit 2
MPDITVLHERLIRLFSTALNRDVLSIDSDLFETGVLDSMAFVELLLHLEQEFGVSTSIDDMEIENFRSIGCIANFLTARGAGHATPPAEPQRAALPTTG